MQRGRVHRSVVAGLPSNHEGLLLAFFIEASDQIGVPLSTDWNKDAKLLGGGGLDPRRCDAGSDLQTQPPQLSIVAAEATLGVGHVMGGLDALLTVGKQRAAQQAHAQK